MQALFYASGALGMIWFTVWMIFASNDPTQNNFVSETERKKILMERQEFQQNNKLLPPMHKILKIPTVWMCAISDFGQSVAVYFIITEGPTFMNKVLGKDITTVRNKT